MALEDEFGAGVYAIPSATPEEDAAGEYERVAQSQDDAALQRWMNETIDDAGGDAGGDVPRETNAPTPEIPDPQEAPNGGGAADENDGNWWETAKAVLSDVGGGLVEGPRQAVGGFADAFDEAGQALGELTGVGGFQIMNDDGEFAPDYLSWDEWKDQDKTDFVASLQADPARTGTGEFVNATAQFLTGFIPAVKGARAVGIGGKVLPAVAGGAMADAVVFDPHEDRLSTMLNEIPMLEPYVSDYLADNNPENESSWEGRFKNVLEGGALGLAVDGAASMFKAFKYYKAQRKVMSSFAPDSAGAQAEAARDAYRTAAREELVQDVPDEALAALGNPDAPLIVQGGIDETSEVAFKRVVDATKRAEAAIINNDALGKIATVRENASKLSGTGEDTFDTLLDAVRSGDAVAARDVGGKRPVAGIVKGLGGVKPKSQLAAELKARGITAKTHPGMFRKDGLSNIDNIPVAEQELFSFRGLDDGNGNVPEGSWIDALEAEAKGEPWRTAEQQRIIDEQVAPMEAMEQELGRLGIDPSEMSNKQIRQRLDDIAEEEAAFARLDDAPDGGVTRTADDLDVEDGQRAADLETVAASDQRKIYINHARINSPDDVKAVLQELADGDAAAINAKRGGEVVTNAQTLKASDKEYTEMSDLLGRAPGPMTAAQSVAARKLLTASGEQIVELAKRAEAPNASKADIYNFRRAMAVHYALQSEVVAARTETARALQAWAIPAGADKVRSQAITDLVMREGGAGDLQAMAKMVSSMADSPTGVNVMARELGKGKFGRAMYQVWINGILSSPKTHIVNITSNAMVALWSIPEKYMAAGISKAFYNGEIQAAEGAAQAFGMVKGVRDGLRLIAHNQKAGDKAGLGDVFDAFGKADFHGNDISAEAFGLGPEGAFGRGIDMLGKAVNLPGTALAVEDKLFKSMGYRMELQALAYRTAAGEGLEGKEMAARVADILLDPPSNLKADAIDAAHYMTFTNELGKKGKQFQTTVNKIPGMKLVLPFIRTPTNIIKYTFERTPLAYMSGAIRSDIKAGGPKAAQAHARVALGSMAMLTIADMTMEETVTGRGPTDPGMRRAKMQSGWMPYSVKIGDRWYSYSRTDPIGMMMGIGADMAEITANTNDEEGEMLATAGVLALANNMANKTYMTGIYDFIAAIDPSNNMSDPGKYIADFTGSMVPFSSFIRNTTGTIDPIIRDTRSSTRDVEGEEDEVATYLQGLIDRQRKLIPGYSDELPARRDLYGEEISRASGLGWAYDMLSPIASRVDNPDPVTKAIIDNQVKISNPPRMIEGVKLTAEEYSEFSELAGKPLKEYLDKLVASDGFNRMSGGPEGMKAEVIRDAVQSTRRRAKSLMIQRHPNLKRISIQRKRERIKNLQETN